MRLKLFAVLVVLMIVAGCGSKKVDLVNGVPPMSNSLSSIASTQDDLAVMPPAARGEHLEANWPHLAEDVVFYLRDMHKLSPGMRVRRVEFKFGSLDNVRAESRDGEQYGYFEDQLIAIVHPQTGDPITVLVQCLNGTFALPGDVARLQTVGSHTPQEQFTIGPREGLIHHVDYPVAIDLAERHHLPLYRGQTMAGRNRISPDEARRLEATTDRLQVTVYVVQGDRFDLVAGTFTPSSRRR